MSEITAVLCIAGEPSEVATALRHHADRIDTGRTYAEIWPCAMVRDTGSVCGEEPMAPARMYAVVAGEGDGSDGPTALFATREQAEAFVALACDDHDAVVVRADVVGLLWNSHKPDPTEAP